MMLQKKQSDPYRVHGQPQIIPGYCHNIDPLEISPYGVPHDTSVIHNPASIDRYNITSPPGQQQQSSHFHFLPTLMPLPKTLDTTSIPTRKSEPTAKPSTVRLEDINIPQSRMYHYPNPQSYLNSPALLFQNQFAQQASFSPPISMPFAIPYSTPIVPPTTYVSTETSSQKLNKFSHNVNHHNNGKRFREFQFDNSSQKPVKLPSISHIKLFNFKQPILSTEMNPIMQKQPPPLPQQEEYSNCVLSQEEVRSLRSYSDSQLFTSQSPLPKFENVHDLSKRHSEHEETGLHSPKRFKTSRYEKFAKNTRFFSNILIDEKFIARYARYDNLLDKSVAGVQTLIVSENQILRWTILEFLHMIKLNPLKGRVNQDSLLLDPNKVFKVHIDITVCKQEKTKKIDVDLILMKVTKNSLTRREIIDEFFRLYNNALKQQFETPEFKRLKKKPPAKPIWGPGCVYELKTLDIEVKVTDVE